MTEKNKSCGYEGKRVDEDIIINGVLVGRKGDVLIGACQEGKCWHLLPVGIAYLECTKCSAPKVEPVSKKDDTVKAPGNDSDIPQRDWNKPGVPSDAVPAGIEVSETLLTKAIQSPKTENKSAGKPGKKDK